MSENHQKVRKLRRLRRPHRPHHANQITTEDSPHRLPKGGDRAKSSRVEARRPWRRVCPRWPPPHPERDGAVPGAAGEGMGRCGSHHPRALTPGAGRGVQGSPGGEGAGQVSALRPIGSRGSYRDGETISDESDDIRKAFRRDPKITRTFIVAAGGCPAPFRRNGVRRLRGAASRRGAGLTADLPRLRRGKGG
jgi:hypothetical protein